jgi:hypothetical protein
MGCFGREGKSMAVSKLEYWNVGMMGGQKR